MNDLNFSIDKYDLQEISDTEIMKIRMWIVSEGDNRHGKPISWEAIVAARPTLIGKPVVALYDKYIKDFMGHEVLEVPIGVVLSDDDISFDTDEDGKRWLVADGYLWYRYAKNATDVMSRDKIKNLSMEILVTESGENDSIESFVFTGITLISSTPAIPNARAEVIKFSEVTDEIKHILQAQFEEKKYNIDLTIPEEIKCNVKNGMEMESKSKKSGSAVGTSFARYLLSNEKITVQKAKELSKYFSKMGNNGDKNSNAYISYLLRGGDEGLKWSEKINKILEKEEYASMKKEKFEDAVDEKEKVDAVEKEENKEEMSLDQNLETAAANVALEEEAEKEKETVDEEKMEEAEEKMSADEEKMEDDKEAAGETADEENKEDMEAEKETEDMDYKTYFENLKSEFEVLKAEADELRKFKSDIEEKQVKERMDYVMNEVSTTDMPKEEMEDWCNKFAEFSDIGTWENAVKASAFKYTKKEAKKDEVIKYGMPNTDTKEKPKGVWARI